LAQPPSPDWHGTDQKAASALSLDLAGKVVTVLDCGIEDLLEIVEE
jgi:hypothetical protein